MIPNVLLQFGALLGLLLLLSKPLGEYLGRVLERDDTILDRILGPVERGIYRLSGIARNDRMDWKAYSGAVLLFSALGIVFLVAFVNAIYITIKRPVERSNPMEQPGKNE